MKWLLWLLVPRRGTVPLGCCSNEEIDSLD